MRYGKERIYGLLNEKLSGSISQGENRLIEQIIAEDADTAVLWEQMKGLHEQKGKAMAGNINEDAAWDKMRSRLDITAPHKRFVNKALTTKWPLATMIAASVGVIAIVTSVIFMNSQPKRATGGIAAVAPPIAAEKPAPSDVVLSTSTGVVYNLSGAKKSFHTADGAVVNANAGGLSFSAPSSASSKDLNTLRVPAQRQYHLSLSDGTEVWMNATSTLWFPFAFGNTTRDVYIEGEALFKVAKNASKPFIVHTKGTDVRVLGTTFNVNTYENNKVYTSLVEGSVLTYSIGDTIHLKPGDQSVYKEGRKLVKNAFSQDDVLGWRESTCRFHDAPLNTVLTMAGKWYGFRVRFDDPQTSDLHFSGEIDKNKPVNVLLENLQLSSGLRFAWADKELHVHAAK